MTAPKTRRTVEDADRVGRVFDYESILRPDQARMRLEGGRLHYDTRAPLVCDLLRRECIDEFLTLEGAQPERVLAFAKKHGVLNANSLREPGIYSESLAGWRRVAREANATLRLIAALQGGFDPDPADLEILKRFWIAYPWRMDAKTRRATQVADVLSAWLQRADLRPRFHWRGDSGGIILSNVDGADDGALTLSGALAQQLVLIATNQRAIANCSNCNRTYPRDRRSGVNRRNYCPRCRDEGADKRDASRAYRRRKAIQ